MREVTDYLSVGKPPVLLIGVRGRRSEGHDRRMMENENENEEEREILRLD